MILNVEVVNMDCYSFEFRGKKYFIRRVFEPALFLALTLAIREKFNV